MWVRMNAGQWSRESSPASSPPKEVSLADRSRERRAMQMKRMDATIASDDKHPLSHVHCVQCLRTCGAEASLKWAPGVKEEDEEESKRGADAGPRCRGDQGICPYYYDQVVY